MFRSAGEASKGKARKIVNPLEHEVTGRLCLNKDMSISYVFNVE